MEDKFAKLKRPKYPLPEFIKEGLEKNGLMEKYRARPAYQQNDWVGWISRAKREETKLKRLHEMLTELRSGDKYMGMDYKSEM